jgi:hypothetical protein
LNKEPPAERTTATFKKFDTSGKSRAYLHHSKNFKARAGKPAAGFFNRTAIGLRKRCKFCDRIRARCACSVFDTGAPAVPFVPSDDADFSGGLLGRLAALMGVDPQNPTQPALPPLDDGLRGFYRDDPMQPRTLQRRR